jgi:hypothetical protein
MAELESTYVVQDRDSQAELNRLISLDHMMTNAMGGVLPEQQDPAQTKAGLVQRDKPR